MSHAIIRAEEKTKVRGKRTPKLTFTREREPNYSFETFYSSAEEAMTVFLSTKDTTDLKVLEF
jgi:hypothetical protein